MSERPVLGLSQGVGGPRCVCGHSHEIHGFAAPDAPCTAFAWGGGTFTPCPCTNYRDASIAAGLADLGVAPDAE